MFRPSGCQSKQPTVESCAFMSNVCTFVHFSLLQVTHVYDLGPGCRQCGYLCMIFAIAAIEAWLIASRSS